MARLSTTRRLLAGALIAAAYLFASARPARATVVEMIAAVVGERAILLSDVRERAKPLLVRIYQELPPGAQRNAATSQAYKTVVERMVDEELQQRAANRSKIVVDAREVDDAIARIAAQNGIDVDQLVTEAMKTGIDERSYRNEIRRQVLEAKLLNLRVQGRIRVGEEDMRAMYRRLVMDERKKLGFRAAWIRIDAPDSAHETLKRKRALAESLADQARRGADFAALARQYSDDTSTRGRGGDLGKLQPGRLAPTIDTQVMALEEGQVSGVIRLGDSFFVVKLLSREDSELPLYTDAKNELAERVYLEKMGKARRAWLDGLRKQTHVEIRI
jgi:peptidyl-prolyl cis-trans isomerase SurA